MHADTGMLLALDSLRFHLDESGPYREVDAFLFQRGAESEHRVTPDDMRKVILSSGADPHLPALRDDHSPHDVGAMGRYSHWFDRQPDSGLTPATLGVDDALRRLAEIRSENGRSIVDENPESGHELREDPTLSE